MSGTSKDAQPPAGAEEGRGDSSQDQSHVTRPAEQAQGETGSVKKKKKIRPLVFALLLLLLPLYTFCILYDMILV